MTGMRRLALFLLASMMLAPLSAAPRKPAPKSTSKLPATEEKLIQSCDAHKFETVIDVIVDGQPKKSKVKLCGVEGQSNADWIGTLKDAIGKLEANKEMPAAQRDQIVSAIRAEIGRLSIVGTPVPAPKREATEQPASPLSRDYAALPPMPPPLAAAPSIAPPPATPVEIATSQQPTQSAPAPVAVPPPPPPPAPVVALPKMGFACYTPGDIGGEGPCAEFEHETLLTLQSKGNVPMGTALHFIRNGEDRAEVDLAPLSHGGSMRVVLPRDVCSGFGAGRLELQVVVNGSPARSEGPFPLRCY